jgi:hypothetical protein
MTSQSGAKVTKIPVSFTTVSMRWGGRRRENTHNGCRHATKRKIRRRGDILWGEKGVKRWRRFIFPRKTQQKL